MLIWGTIKQTLAGHHLVVKTSDDRFLSHGGMNDNNFGRFFDYEMGKSMAIK
ncbi:hypothetical protein MH1LPH_01990 [Lactiplantibacillus brownii]